MRDSVPALVAASATALVLAAAASATACKTPGRDRAERPAAAPEDSAATGPEATTPPAPAAGAGDHGQISVELGPVPADLAAKVELSRVVRGASRPVALEHAPGDASGRLFVAEQRGLVRILRDGALAEKPFIDLSGEVSRRHEEQGLLGLAFHPRYSENRRFYVNYTDRRGETRVVEYRADPRDPDRADPASARLIFQIDQPWGNHNGGHLAFGPDGKLYIGTGDGGSAGDPRGAGQDRDNLLGKMLRFDVDAKQPRPEVIAWGLRNPWRYSFDSRTGDLYVADVGQDRWEWVTVVAGGDYEGHNYGWNVTEGSHCFRPRTGCDRSGITLPAVEYSHDVGCSITGGHVYRGKAIPELDGVYFYADYCTAIVRSFRWSREGVRQHWDWKPVLDPNFRLATISSFGVDADGEVYVLSLDGVIYKLVRR